MKLQPDRADGGINLITRHDASSIWIGNTRFGHSLLVPWHGEVEHWSPAGVEDLAADHFDALLRWQPELVIFGSGARLHFVAPVLLRGLIERGIGVETMDTAAACRTYNVLAAEGRTVLGALLLRPPVVP